MKSPIDIQVQMFLSFIYLFIYGLIYLFIYLFMYLYIYHGLPFGNQIRHWTITTSISENSSRPFWHWRILQVIPVFVDDLQVIIQSQISERIV